MTTAHEVGLLRLVAQGLVGVGDATPEQAVTRLLAVQGQDLPGALVSVALRTASRAVADVVDALDTGRVVRTWPMRGTLHLVPAEDARWLVATLAPRALRRAAARRAELGLDEEALARAAEVADRVLAPPPGPDRTDTPRTDTPRTDTPRSGASRGGLPRAGLLQAWAEAGVRTDGQRGYHLIAHLAQTGLLCQGPVVGTEQLLVRTADHLPAGPDLSGDEALGAVALRYLRGHGPATLADLVRWAGLTVGEARTGVALARPHLMSTDVDGTEHLLDPAVPDRLAAHRDEAEQVLLLPGFDEFLLGYADRGAVLPAVHARRVVPGGNGVFRATVVDAGQVVGLWRSRTRRGVAELDAEPFTAFRPAVRRALPAVHAGLPRARG